MFKNYEPDVMGKTKDGTYGIVSSDPYVILANISLGMLIYTAKDNKFFTGEDHECPAKVLEEKYLRYLRWDHDILVDEEIETTDDKGRTKKVKTGYQISLFPCSPENIAKKRSELINAAISSNEQPDFSAILNSTRPTGMIENEKFRAKLDEATPQEQMARNLNRYVR